MTVHLIRFPFAAAEFDALLLYHHYSIEKFINNVMAENIENRIESGEKRRRKLNKKESNLSPETVEKTSFFADEKREKYLEEGREDTGVPWQD